MKIIDNRSFINIDAYVRNIDENKKVDTTCKNNTNSVLKEDKVELSSAAIKLQEAKKIMDSIPDIREQKIAQIKTQIENGTYQIDGRKTASGLLKESLLNDLL